MKIIEVVHEYRDMSKVGTPGPRRVPLRVAFRDDQIQSVRETFTLGQVDKLMTTITLFDDSYSTRELVVDMPYETVLKAIGWTPETLS